MPLIQSQVRLPLRYDGVVLRGGFEPPVSRLRGGCRVQFGYRSLW